MYNRRAEDFELNIHNDNTLRLRITVTRNDTAVSLTGATFKAIFRRWATDVEANALLVLTDQSYFIVETPSSGVAILVIPADEMVIFEDGTSMHLEVIMTESDGTVTSVADGTLTVW